MGHMSQSGDIAGGMVGFGVDRRPTASATQIPVAEYLKTSNRPDREYTDGEVRERNVGKWERDYRAMGVETVWIIDPKTRSGRICVGAEWGARRSEVAGTEMFVELDRCSGSWSGREWLGSMVRPFGRMWGQGAQRKAVSLRSMPTHAMRPHEWPPVHWFGWRVVSMVRSRVPVGSEE
jgi:hypothetical protein